MSGLVALFAPRLPKPQREIRLKALAAPLKHRGPDRFNDWYDDKTPLSIALHRLSLVDLSVDAAQPMISTLGRYVIAMDGEIANAAALRIELETSGLSFRTRSDAEVLLSAIEAWGLNTACQKIKGAFAIALWDSERKHLHLIRDRFGEKPLYVGWVGNDFICASNLKSFLFHPDFRGEISRASVSLYLRLGFVPEPHSIFSGIHRLTPGCRILLDLSAPRPGEDLLGLMDPYWSPARVIEEARLRRVAFEKVALGDRIAETGRMIEASVRDRMSADVPLGVFFSGSVGSALVVALMQKHATRPVKTINMGLVERDLERPRALARHLGTEHAEKLVTPADLSAALADLSGLAGEPFADPALIPSLLLARFARDHVTVALTGHGARELFGGYDYYHRLPRLIARYAFLPTSIRKSLAAYKGPGEQAAALLHTRFDETYERLIGGGENTTLLRGAEITLRYPFRQSGFWPTALSMSEWLMVADFLHVLPNRVLTRLDCTTMACGLQTRMPFLDPRVFTQAWSLPEKDRIHGGEDQWMLRRLLQSHVPEPFISKPSAASVPLSDWLRGALKHWTSSILSSPTLVDRFDMDPAVVHAVWHGHLAGKPGGTQTLWRLIMLALWDRNWRMGQETDTVRSKAI